MALESPPPTGGLRWAEESRETRGRRVMQGYESDRANTVTTNVTVCVRTCLRTRVCVPEEEKRGNTKERKEGKRGVISSIK